MHAVKKRRKKPKVSEYDYIFKKNMSTILRGICGTHTQLQVESTIGFAKYLNHVGINNGNYPLFLKLIETNNRWIVDTLVAERNPKLMFSSIKPNKYLVKKAFKFLSYWHPKQIYPKVLLAMLGIIECAFYNADDGYKIYRITINDLNNLGKYLDIEKDQFYYENSLLLDVLDRITKIGNYEETLQKSVLSKHAFNIRIAYFDNTKKLLDIIPQVLLININREDYEVNPSKEYINFINSTNSEKN